MTNVIDLMFGEPTADSVRELLREVIDPELGINIVDLGLLRGVAVAPGGSVRIVTTLTTPACPLGPYITEQITDLLNQVANITHVDVEVVWSPPWNPDQDMTQRAKQLLGWRS